jgi:uncharacterized membrane protein YhdT
LLQKAIDILKERWPEVMLVVVLQAAMMLLVEEVALLAEKDQSQAAAMPFGPSFVLGMGLMFIAICWQMLYLGFLKTAANDGGQSHTPMELLSGGRPYFWRIFFFQILLGFALMYLNTFLASFLGKIIWPERSFADFPAWFTQSCGVMGILITLKPMLLVTAGILVYDISTIEAFFSIRRFQLLRIDQIKVVIITGFAAVLLTALLAEQTQSKTGVYYIFSGLHYVVFSMVLFSLTLMAVLWMQQQFDLEHVKAEEVEQ